MPGPRNSAICPTSNAQQEASAQMSARGPRNFRIREKSEPCTRADAFSIDALLAATGVAEGTYGRYKILPDLELGAS